MRFDTLTPATRTSPLRRFLPLVLPRRSDAALFFEMQIRHAPIQQFLLDHPDTSLFHVVLAAVLRILVERPRLNRTVLGGRIFDRDELSITFAVKKGKRDDARIVSTKVRFEPRDTLFDVQRRVDEAIARSRDPQASTASEAEMEMTERFPRFLIRRALGGLSRLERLGLAPRWFTRDDPAHTSLFVANLGSIGLDASFHHLSNHGTASMHLTIGRLQDAVVVSDSGEPEVAECFSLRLALDDRIVDGFYCAKSLERLQHWLSHPEALAQPRPTRTDLVVAHLWKRALETPEEAAYHLRSTTENGWFATSWSSMLHEVRAVGRSLIALGVQPGDRVAIQGSNRPEWTLTYLGAQAVGAVPCGLHEDLAPADLTHALKLARPSVVLLENEGPEARVREALPDVQIVSMVRDSTTAMPWGDFVERGHLLDDGEVERRLNAISPGDPAVVVFTSGTSGRSRAAVLSHANLSWTAKNALSALRIEPGETTISYLPLSHVAEQNFSIVVALVGGASVAYAPSRGGVLDTLREFRPTVFFGVPQIWSRIERELQGDLSNVGLDRVKRAISGAAALDPSLFTAFQQVGLELLQTYGQTEGCGPTTLTQPGDSRPGTCGPAFPGVDLRIAEDGEVLFRGGNVFKGYLDDPEATAAILKEGWLHTGDLGVAENGHLRILGRKKALLVTTGGDNIAPEPLEARLESLPLLDRAMVVGNDRPHLAALVTLDASGVVGFLQQRGVGPAAATQAHPLVRGAVQEQIDTLNATLSKAEQVRTFAILPHALTPEDGDLTPTLKLRRAVIEERWASHIRRLYDRRRTAKAPGRGKGTGFVARPAHSHEHDALFALRHQVFADAGHLATGAYPDGVLRDRFDDGAVHFALHDDSGELAGTARFLPGRHRLAVEDLFDFDRLLLDPETVGEIGRLCIAPRWKARRAPVVTLVRAVLDYTESIGVPHAYAFVPARSIRGYQAIGLSVWEVPMRPPRQEIRDARKPMQPYFDTQDPRVVFFTDPARRHGR